MFVGDFREAAVNNSSSDIRAETFTAPEALIMEVPGFRLLSLKKFSS